MGVVHVTYDILTICAPCTLAHAILNDDQTTALPLPRDFHRRHAPPP